jgi:L-fuculose-phosphate aldolase
MGYEAQRELLCDICRRLFDRGLAAGADGNISMRLDDDTMLITPSGVCKGLLQPEQVLVQRFDGAVLEGTLRSTKEAKLHIALYRNREDVGAVIHTHPPCATAFAACGKPIPLNVIIELPVLLGETAVAGYARPGSAQLVEEVEQHANSDVILLQNHGVIIQSKDLITSFIMMDALENAAKTILYANSMGCIQTISQDEVDAILYK